MMTRWWQPAGRWDQTRSFRSVHMLSRRWGQALSCLRKNRGALRRLKSTMCEYYSMQAPTLGCMFWYQLTLVSRWVCEQHFISSRNVNSFMNKLRACEVSGCRSDVTENSCLMGYDTVSLGQWFPIFQGFMVLSPSRVMHHDPWKQWEPLILRHSIMWKRT